MYHGFHKNIKQHNYLYIDDNKHSWGPNHHIKMISEGSCDTEDWSNIYWKCISDITGRNYILIYSIKLSIIFHNITVLLYFLSNKSRFSDTLKIFVHNVQINTK